ncbi:50S ribosomal protein L17 [bacterium]|nr:50S ribosomal protein L17 [bacterium]
MRHRNAITKLGRTASHRKAVLANLACALFERKHITTTEAKAKAVRPFSERLITLGRKGTLHARRLALSTLRQKKAVRILFDEIAPEFAGRPGGYTRIVKLGQRAGDGARMAIIELVGFETASKKKKIKEEKAEAAKKKKKGEKTEPSKKEEAAKGASRKAASKKEAKAAESPAESKKKESGKKESGKKDSEAGQGSEKKSKKKETGKKEGQKKESRKKNS